MEEGGREREEGEGRERGGWLNFHLIEMKIQLFLKEGFMVMGM